MASPTQWMWVWASLGSWWWTRKPGVLQPMGSQRVGHEWETELNWHLLNQYLLYLKFTQCYMSIMLPKCWGENADAWVRSRDSDLTSLEWSTGIVKFEVLPTQVILTYSQNENCTDTTFFVCIYYHCSQAVFTWLHSLGILLSVYLMSLLNSCQNTIRF